MAQQTDFEHEIVFVTCIRVRARPSVGSLPLPFVFELANLNDNHGYVIGHSAVSPGGEAIENRLFHFGKSSRRRLTDNLFKSLNTEHVSGPIEHLDEPIGVENHSIAGRKQCASTRLHQREI